MSAARNQQGRAASKRDAGPDRSALYNSLFTFVVLLLIGLLLIYNGTIRYQQYRDFEQTSSVSAAKDAAVEISQFVRERQRMVALFAEENIDVLAGIHAQSKLADAFYPYLAEQAERFFPDYFAVTVFDESGVPLIDDFEGVIGQVCLEDTQLFLQTGQHRARIHPNPAAYHFDVMTPWQYKNQNGLLLISFHADFLGQLLMVHQSPGHLPLLVYPEMSNLIEATPDGARNNWDRDDYRMQPDELRRVLVKMPVEGTRWQVFDLHVEGLFQDRIKRIAIESVTIFASFLILAMGSLWLLRREGLRRQRAELAKDQFVSLVSHELRTPLTSIRGALSLISNGVTGDVNGKTRDMASRALNNSEQLGLLVDDLLDLQKIRAGKLEYNKKSVLLSPVVEKTLASCEPYAERFGAHFKLVCRDEDLRVMIDAHRIEQVLANLLSNAVKYGAERDSITVTVERLASSARVSVTDHGEGVAEEFRDQLFDAFSQAGGDHAHMVKGTGLGLHIVKVIMEEHDGRVGFITTPWQGSTFYIELPLQK